MFVVRRGFARTTLKALGVGAFVLAVTSLQTAGAADIGYTVHSHLDEPLCVGDNRDPLGVTAGQFSTDRDGGAPFDIDCLTRGYEGDKSTAYPMISQPTELLTTGTGKPANGSKLGWLSSHSAGSVATWIGEVALPLAIWEILANGGGGLDKGISQRSTAAATVDETDPHSRIGTNPDNTGAWLVADNRGEENQTLDLPSVTPEPSSLALLAAGGLPLLGLRRRGSSARL